MSPRGSRPGTPITGGRHGVIVHVEPGEVYGALVVEAEVRHAPYEHRRFRCRCVCGNTTIARLDHLRLGETRSCGCSFGCPPPAVVRVRALQRGQFGGRLMRPGDVFDVPSAQVNRRWMKRVPADTPTSRQTARDREGAIGLRRVNERVVDEDFGRVVTADPDAGRGWFNLEEE